MSREDKELLIIIGSVVFFFGLLFTMLIAGGVVRYRVEKPHKEEIIIPEEFQGSKLLYDMRIGFIQSDPGNGEGLISRFPVTNSQYRWFMEAQDKPKPPSFLEPSQSGGKSPVFVDSIEDARGFCTWLSDESGLQISLSEPWSSPGKFHCVLVNSGASEPAHKGGRDE